MWRVSDDGPITSLATSTGAVVRKPSGKETGYWAERLRANGGFHTAVETTAGDEVADARTYVIAIDEAGVVGADQFDPGSVDDPDQLCNLFRSRRWRNAVPLMTDTPNRTFVISPVRELP